MTSLPSLSNDAERIRRLERLLEMNRGLSYPQELELSLQNLVAAIVEFTQSGAGWIFTFEAETGLLKFIATPVKQREKLKRIRVPLENNVVGQCYQQKMPVVVHDASRDPRILSEIEQALGFQIVSTLVVPLLFQGEIFGVLEAVNKQNSAHYTEEDLTILESLACQAAILLQTAQMKEVIQQAQRSASQLERMKKDFVAIASHELRTPLGLILGHTTFLQESVREPELQKQVKVVLDSALRLKGILEDLGNFERLEKEQTKVRRRQFALEQVIADLVASYQDTALEKRIIVISDLPEQSLIIDGDVEKISTALNNLIKNAVTYTNPGGHVLVSAESLPGFAKVSVVDDGIGIPQKDLNRVFEKFFQVESHMTRRHGGMGLGLSVAKAMIELHGGQIWAESIEGRGSNFSFLLPKSGTKSLKRTRAFESLDI